MSKFLETLIAKIFDFLNFGRILSMFLPGFLLAFSVSMPISLLSPPISLTGDIQPLLTSPSDNVYYLFKNTTDNNSDIWIPYYNPIYNRIISSNIDERESILNGNLNKYPNKYTPENVFLWRIHFDFDRIKRNLILILIVTFPLGVLNYQTAYFFLKKRLDNITNQTENPPPPPNKEGGSSMVPRRSIILYIFNFKGHIFKILTFLTKKTYSNKMDLRLFKYSSEFDSSIISKRFNPDSSSPVGSIYFAPFLKEKFSGDDNYYNILITEYYRFLEFSYTILSSILLSWISMIIYYLSFYFLYSLNSPPLILRFSLIMIIIAFIVFLYWIRILPKTVERYLEARKDLIDGVTDFMKKGLAEKVQQASPPNKT